MEESIKVVVSRKRKRLEERLEDDMKTFEKCLVGDCDILRTKYENERKDTLNVTCVKFDVVPTICVEAFALFETTLPDDYVVEHKKCEESCLDDDGPYGSSSWINVTVSRKL